MLHSSMQPGRYAHLFRANEPAFLSHRVEPSGVRCPVDHVQSRGSRVQIERIDVASKTQQQQKWHLQPTSLCCTSLWGVWARSQCVLWGAVCCGCAEEPTVAFGNEVVAEALARTATRPPARTAQAGSRGYCITYRDVHRRPRPQALVEAREPVLQCALTKPAKPPGRHEHVELLLKDSPASYSTTSAV
jgi:hypothetical protein